MLFVVDGAASGSSDRCARCGGILFVMLAYHRGGSAVASAYCVAPVLTLLLLTQVVSEPTCRCVLVADHQVDCSVDHLSKTRVAGILLSMKSYYKTCGDLGGRTVNGAPCLRPAEGKDVNQLCHQHSAATPTSMTAAPQ